jgi:DNA-binding NarL/FixJ family response regulator
MTRAPFALIDDDLRLLCDALLATLRATLNVDAVVRASTLAEALDQLRRRPVPELMLLDPAAAWADSLGDLAQLAGAAPGAAIIVLPALDEHRVVASVVQFASSAPLDGPHALEPGARVDISDGNGRDEPHAISLLRSLTPRQNRILQLVCEGKFNKQIAYHLDISEGTVKAHLTAILRKLNVQNRTQAVLLAQNARFAPATREVSARATARPAAAHGLADR